MGKGSRCGEAEETPRSLQLLDKPRAAHADEGGREVGRERGRGEVEEKRQGVVGVVEGVARPLLGSCKWTRLTRLISGKPTGQSLEVLLGTKVSLRSAAEACSSSDTLEVSAPPADG